MRGVGLAWAPDPPLHVPIAHAVTAGAQLRKGPISILEVPVGPEIGRGITKTIISRAAQVADLAHGSAGRIVRHFKRQAGSLEGLQPGDLVCRERNALIIDGAVTVGNHQADPVRPGRFRRSHLDPAHYESNPQHTQDEQPPDTLFHRPLFSGSLEVPAFHWEAQYRVFHAHGADASVWPRRFPNPLPREQGQIRHRALGQRVATQQVVIAQ